MSAKKSLDGDVYYPSDEVVKQANVQDYDSLYKRSVEEREDFWAEQAEHLEWYAKWDKVLDDSNKPFYKWFVGAKTNIVHNAIDRHLKTWRRNKLALIWEGEPEISGHIPIMHSTEKCQNLVMCLKVWGSKKVIL